MKSESERMMDVAELIHSTLGNLVTVSCHVQKLWCEGIDITYSASFGITRKEFDSIGELELWASTYKHGNRNEILFRKFDRVIK